MRKLIITLVLLFVSNVSHATLTVGNIPKTKTGGTAPALENSVIKETTSGNIGVSVSSPTQKLDVSGTVKATAFIGDGSALTGIGSASISDTVYGASWNGDTTTGASKNALYDKIETIVAGGGGTECSTSPCSLNASTTLNSVAIVTTTGSQTLTNKTLTTPIIGAISNTGTITLPTATTTLVGRDTTDTLTNKTINGSNNTITNVSLTSGVTGVLSVANFSTGTPNGSKFVRDDGVLAVPPGSGTINSGTTNQVAVYTGTTTVGSGIITDNGTNVGIGSLLPIVKLDVVGSVNISGTATFSGAGNSLFSGNIGIGTSTASSLLAVGNTTSSQARISSTGGYTQIGTAANTFTGTPTFSNATYSLLATGGNVGIGSTAPGVKLDVTGTARFSGGITGTGTSDLNISNTNVGIGTTVPGATLHVIGEFRNSGTASEVGKAKCVKANGDEGTCTSVVDVSGGCTCS